MGYNSSVLTPVPPVIFAACALLFHCLHTKMTILVLKIPSSSLFFFITWNIPTLMWSGSCGLFAHCKPCWRSWLHKTLACFLLTVPQYLQSIPKLLWHDWSVFSNDFPIQICTRWKKAVIRMWGGGVCTLLMTCCTTFNYQNMAAAYPVWKCNVSRQTDLCITQHTTELKTS